MEELETMDVEKQEQKEQKKKKKKKRRKKHLFLDLLIMIVLIAGTVVFMNSGFFDLDEVVVENNSYFTSEQVVELADIKTGCNLFFGLRSGKIKENLLQDPYIKAVDVHRKLPNKLVISLTERTEFAAVCYSRAYYILDQDALILRKAETEPALTLLEGMTLTNIEPGTPLKVEQNSMLTGTLKLLTAAEEAGIYFKKVEVGPVTVKAFVYDTLLCEGTTKGFQDNMKGLQAILKDLYEKEIKYGTIHLGADGYYSFSPKVETSTDTEKADTDTPETTDTETGSETQETGTNSGEETQSGGSSESSSGGTTNTDDPNVIDEDFIGD